MLQSNMPFRITRGGGWLDDRRSLFAYAACVPLVRGGVVILGVTGLRAGTAFI